MNEIRKLSQSEVLDMQRLLLDISLGLAQTSPKEFSKLTGLKIEVCIDIYSRLVALDVCGVFA